MLLALPGYWRGRAAAQGGFDRQSDRGYRKSTYAITVNNGATLAAKVFGLD
jgi:hypothetical protein